MQLACLQKGLIFCPYDSTFLSEDEIRQRIRTSAIDCVITNTDNLETIMKITHNSLRPLKKGLISHCSRSEPLPIGWHHLMYNDHDDKNKNFKISYIQSKTHRLRHLSMEKPINEYSQARLCLQQLITA